MNSNATLVYCFSKKLCLEIDRYEKALQFLKTSIEYNKRFNPIILYVDQETLQDVQGLVEDIRVKKTTNFIFTDDFKISLLSELEPNEVLIDIDIFIFEPLIFDLTVDLVYDTNCNSNKEWYITGKEIYRAHTGSAFVENINDTNNWVPNIGFLKINNRILLESYISSYRRLTNPLRTKNIKNSDLHYLSILFGQNLLGTEYNKGNYTKKSVRNSNTLTSYVHYGGTRKYDEDFKSKLVSLEIQNKKRII